MMTRKQILSLNLKKCSNSKAQKYVNGLTDGWYEFKFSFEKVLKSNRQNMTKEQNEIAEFLFTTLNRTLTNR